MKTTIFLKHTTTVWNRGKKRIQGQADVRLDEQGKEETLEASEKLKKLGIKLVISSDLKRAAQTAQIIAEALRLPINFDPRLIECSFGTLEGMFLEDARAKYGEAFSKNWDDNFKSYDFREFGGENQPAVAARHLKFFEELKKTPEDVILLVGHSRGLETLLFALGQPIGFKRGDYFLMEIE